MSDTQVWTLAFVGLSFALYIGIAWRSRVSDTAGFYVAGGGIPAPANGAAIAADWMSAASFISMAGLIALSYNGYSGSAYLMGWTGGYVLLALLLAPYLRKFAKYTIPDFVGDRYNETARLIAVACAIVISLTYVIGQMAGAGVVFSRFLGVSTTAGVVIGMSVVFFYAVLGGMKGITWTQVAQYSVLICAYLIPAFAVSQKLTGIPMPHIGFGDIMSELDGLQQEFGFGSYTGALTGGDQMNMFLLTASLMFGTAGLPHVIVRFYTATSVRAARYSALWALFFIALLYTVAPAVGAMARLNILTTIYPEGTRAAESLSYEARPDWMRTWEQTGLLAFEDKNGDGMIQSYNEASPEFATVAAERGWQGNEMVTFNQDILVLANPEIAQLPGWVIALIAAGGLAAALSTAAGLLLAISSAVSHDLIKRTFKPDITEKGELLAARVSMAAAIVVATWLGMNPPGFAAQTVAFAFGLAASSLFPAIMMGIFSTRMNSTGAIVGMLAGLISTSVYLFTYKGWFFIPGTNMLPDTPDNWLFGISPLAFGAVGAVINFIAAYITMKMTAPVPEHIQHLVEDIRLPRGASAATGHH